MKIQLETLDLFEISSSQSVLVPITVLILHRGRDSPGSMSGCSTASARWVTAAGWSGAAAPPPPGQTAPAGSPRNTPAVRRSLLSYNNSKIQKQSAMFLSVKRIVVEKVGAVELLAVCLVHGDHVILPFEYLNL